MNESFDRYYEESILKTTHSYTKLDSISHSKLKLLVNGGLSSVRIGKALGISYPSVLSLADKIGYGEKLRENGRKSKIRKVS